MNVRHRLDSRATCKRPARKPNSSCDCAQNKAGGGVKEGKAGAEGGDGASSVARLSHGCAFDCRRADSSGGGWGGA